MLVTVLAIGDIIGRPGREAVARLVPQLRREFSIDLVVANGENAAGGFGLTPKIADDLFSLGIDVLTSGNHIWDQREMMTGFEDHRPILRPHNYPSGAPGRGWFCHDLGEKGQVLIGNVQGQLFMPPIDSAFKAADEVLRQGPGTKLRLMDVHAEATSEKIAMGWFLDGRVSFVFGTHTHVPTADTRGFPGGTALVSDLGMTGSYGGVICMKKGDIINRFTSPIHRKPDHSRSEARICGAVIDVDEETGRARSIERLNLSHEP